MNDQILELPFLTEDVQELPEESDPKIETQNAWMRRFNRKSAGAGCECGGTGIDCGCSPWPWY